MLVPERPGGALMVPAGVLVPSEQLPQLLAVLRCYRDLAHGAAPPTAAVQPRWTPMLAALLDVLTTAAVEYQRERCRGTPATIPQQVIVAGSLSPVAHAGAFQDGVVVVDVARAAVILGVSPRYIRVLAATGGLAARKVRCRLTGQSAARVQWQITEVSCRAYRANRGVAA